MWTADKIDLQSGKAGCRQADHRWECHASTRQVKCK